MTNDEALKLEKGAIVRWNYPSPPSGGDFFDRKITHTVDRVVQVPVEDRSDDKDLVRVYLDNGKWLPPGDLIEVYNLSSVMFSDAGDALLFSALGKKADELSYAGKEEIKAGLCASIDATSQHLRVYLSPDDEKVIPCGDWSFR